MTPAPAAVAIAQPPTAAERLEALVTQRLTATGRRALLKAYEAVQSGLADIDAWLAVFSPQADAHLAGLTEAAIAALNEGKHPKSGEQLVNKPGRRPATSDPAPVAAVGEDPAQPFAAA